MVFGVAVAVELGSVDRLRLVVAMGPQRVAVAVTVVGLLRDPAFHAAKCVAEVTPGLRPRSRVGSSRERCGLGSKEA